MSPRRESHGLAMPTQVSDTAFHEFGPAGWPDVALGVAVALPELVGDGVLVGVGVGVGVAVEVLAPGELGLGELGLGEPDLGGSLGGSSIDLERFRRRAGEILASELYHRPTGVGAVVLDVGIAPSERGRGVGSGGARDRTTARAAPGRRNDRGLGCLPGVVRGRRYWRADRWASRT